MTEQSLIILFFAVMMGLLFGGFLWIYLESFWLAALFFVIVMVVCGGMLISAPV